MTWTWWKPKPRPQHPRHDDEPARRLDPDQQRALIAGNVLLDPGCTIDDLVNSTGLPKKLIMHLLDDLRENAVIADDWADFITGGLCRYRATPAKV